MNGFLLLDKPQGLSSNQALGKVKRLFQQKKAGHAGTLDPMATGMLPIALGRATKLLEYLLASDKRYQATVQLGVQTDSGDAEGQVIATETVPSFTEQKLSQIAQQFTGEIQQIPPMYSALKHQGQRLYKLARQGQTVERPPRTVTIRSLKLLHDPAQADQLQLDVTCSKGTYIRVLGEDIATALGTVGHLTALRRLEAAGFRADQMVTLAQLEQADPESLQQYLLPLEAVLTDWPAVDISQQVLQQLIHGQQPDFQLPFHSPTVRLLHQGRLIAIAECKQGKMLRCKLIQTNL